MRKARLFSQRGYYHVMIRGVNKQNIFYEDEDKEYFKYLMKKFGKKLKIVFHTYVIMDNHVHFLFYDRDKYLSKFMQILCSVYARYFNRKYDRVGHLFGDRFVSEPLDTNSSILSACRYILQNPEKAGICKASEYKWSSYNCYKRKQNLIDTSLITSFFKSINDLYKFMNENNEDDFIDIELRASEKQKAAIDLIKKILNSENPIIDPSLPKIEIIKKLQKLKQTRLSINTISRITGIGRYLIQIS